LESIPNFSITKIHLTKYDQRIGIFAINLVLNVGLVNVSYIERAWALATMYWLRS